MMEFISSATSITGRRSNNEDACCAEPTLGLFVVADGMGGYEGGELASQLTVEALRRFYRRNQGDDNCTWPFGLNRALSLPENQLSVGLRLANEAIVARREGPLKSMGSTAAALAIARHGARGATYAVLGHLGDSRVYRVRGGAATVAEQLTRDHSLYEEMATARVPGLMPREECPFANVITRALGIAGEVEPTLRTEEVRPGDLFVLCSDGFSNRVPPERLAALCAESLADPALVDGAALDALGERLVREAYERGEKDNITVVLVLARAAAQATGNARAA